jgi:hypothetical protein
VSAPLFRAPFLLLIYTQHKENGALLRAVPVLLKM